MENLELDELQSIFDGKIQPRNVKLSALQSITDNFSKDRIIGEGGFATVYKGVLRNGEIAVKRIKNCHTIDEKLFHREVNSLLMVNHKNIVRFLGFCSHTEHKAFEHKGSGEFILAEDRERLLCFEYINNGSLENYIADELRGLQWDTRYLIIKGICEGLQYLHTEKRIMHMDLKPANILIDNNMVAKITDFGLSRMVDNSQTKTKNLFFTPGYSAPEFINSRTMSPSYDVYSLGVIIIQLVSGHRSIPDSNNVLTRWSDRWHKSGKETPLRYQQIAKLIEIGLLCQEKDPNKRPFISDIISVINELQSTDGQINHPNESTVGQISGSTSDEVIQFDPPELCFPFVPDKRVLSSIKIINMTEFYVSFHLSFPNKNTAHYCTKDFKSIIPPRSTKPLTITRKEKEDQVKDMSFNEKISVWYAIVAEDDIKACDLDRKDYNERKNLPIVLTNASSCTSNELIQFDPPALRLPFMPNKNLVFSVNIVNNTDFCVGFDVFQLGENVCWFYITPPGGVIPPRSTQRLLVKRISEGKDNEGMECKDKFLLWSRIVSEGVQASDFKHDIDYEGCKELPIVYKTTSLCTSDDLIEFDPPQLSFPFLPNMRVSMVCFFKIINATDHSVGFKIWSASLKDNSAVYRKEPHTGILQPQSSQAIRVRRTLKEQETEDMQCKDKIFVWNGIVTEGVEVSDVAKYCDDEDKELPIVLTKTTSSTLVELIKFEPPEVCFPFLPSKRLLSSFKIVNITDYHIGFNTHAEQTNVALYITEPPCGILAPWSTQELVVTRVAKEEAPELEDMQCKDKYFVWSCFVTEDVNASDLTTYMPETERKELPIVFTDTRSIELIQFEPPELCFPLLPNQRALSSAKMVNITDQYIGFRICGTKSNSARYDANPLEGILPPLSTQVLLVTRVAQESELEDTQCKHKLLVWNGIVTEDVKASDVIAKMSEPKCTELPIVLTKTSLSISDELIQFHPPEHHFPFLTNKKVLSTIKIVNLTDYNVGFNTYTRPTSAAWYYTEPPTGILQPRSTQKLMVTREEKEDALKDKQFNDKYFVWTSVVSEGVKYSDLSDYIADQESKKFPIVLDKQMSSITSDELIQFDPPELCMPYWPNKEIKFVVNVVNTTDFYVAFNVYIMSRNAARHKRSMEAGILPPQATKRRILHWTIDDGEPFEDYFVWSRVVTEGVESEDIVGYMADEESKKLPFIINKVSPCPSDGLIHFDPPELSLPFVPNKPLVFSVNIVNNTDYCVGFNRYRPERNVGVYYIEPAGGVMPPRSTQRLVVTRVPDIDERDDLQCQDKFFLWSTLVSEAVKDNDIFKYINYRGSKELPIVFTPKKSAGVAWSRGLDFLPWRSKTSLSASDELIQFDPPQITFPFLPNKSVSMFCFFKIVNVTDHSVGFNIWRRKSNSADYKSDPDAGILPPHSTQAIKVRRTPKEEEREDMQYKDMLTVWTGIVTRGVEVSDLLTYNSGNKNKELPVVLTKPGGSSSS